MITPPFPTPSSDEARSIHARLVDGDPTAPADLAIAYLDPLTVWLQAHNPRLSDPHLCATAAEDALLALIKNPLSYNPDRQTLEVYLRMSARGDLLNLLDREQRHQNRQASWEAVELSPDRRKYLQDSTSDPELQVISTEEANRTVTIPRGLTPPEERVLSLMLDGERKTVAYVDAMGIGHLPLDDQRREVKRVKDRLKKRIARAERNDV